MNDNGLSAADVAAVTDKGYYPYPAMPYGNSGFGGGFGNGDGWAWIIIILALLGGFNGNNGGFGGSYNNEYAWLSNGQKDIMQNTNQGFDTLQLANQLTGLNSGVQNLSTQLCNSTADITSTINSGFANAETAENARQIANMQQLFGLSTQFADCCCENRLATERLNGTILSENCADRAEIQRGIQSIITNQTANTQRILDQLCNDKIDAKNEKIAELQRELQMADLKASQIEQTAQLRLGQEAEVDALYNRLNNCPVPTTPVYGRTPIFTCNNGCGCNGTYGNTIV